MGLFKRASEPASQTQHAEQDTPPSSPVADQSRLAEPQAKPPRVSIFAPQAASSPSAPASSPSAPASSPSAPASSPSAPASSASSDNDDELQQLREEVSAMHRIISEVADRGSAQEKVFDVLHSELQDYKNDFIYEHLKPVLWPLLFLFDSIEQYAREISAQVAQTGMSQLEAKEVHDHLKFFRGQLVESLRICEVTPMKQPSGPVDPKHHKGIGVEAVDDPADENTIRRVVRTGWFLNGKVLRHAEVIIGKRADALRQANTSVAMPNAAAPDASPVRASSDASASSGGRGS